MNLRFLFWNLNGRPLQRIVAELVQERDLDVLVFAECAIPPAEMLKQLGSFHATRSQIDGLAVFTRFASDWIRPLHEDPQIRLSLRSVQIPRYAELLLGVVHLPSKIHAQAEDTYCACRNVVSEVIDAERERGHENSVLLGDFNANPFEPAMVGADAIHGTMSRRIAERRHRQIRGQSSSFFYNPMWGHFGELTDRACGTYYYHKSRQVEYFWHLFDQVLLRPSLLPGFDDTKLKVLTETGGRSFLSKKSGEPSSDVSDHLPILFELNLKEEG